MAVKLSAQDVADLKKQGYSEQEIAKAVGEIEKEELQGSASSNNNQSQRSTISNFSTGKMDDIARYQLELNDLLEQTEHILKGDILVLKNGQKEWEDNPHPENNPLNIEGIRKVMLELQNYINRHIILGDYDEQDINKIMKGYGNKFKDLIFMKYEEMGMDTEEKSQEYASLVTNVVNLVYGSYSRAKDGGERRSLREMINTGYNYQQQGNVGMQGGQAVEQGNRPRGVLNPMRYIGGKYV